MVKDYSKVKPDVITVDLEPFNMEYIKKMCDSIFDKNSVYVYDYDNKTKEVYDELIKYYSRVEVSDGETFVYVPDELLSDGGWAYQQSMNPTTLEELEDKIQSLKNLKEKAPEKIDNDYHYSGYSGTIDGEEYYMYFGNTIKIDDNLKDYPVGWAVKNCGFKNFEAGNIERMQRYSITKTSEEE